MARTKLWKGLLAGGAAGLAGTLAMNQFQNLWSKTSDKLSNKSDSGSSDQSGEQSEDATMKAAGKLAEFVGHPLSYEQKKKAGTIVHFAFGTGMGVLYGAMLELGPRGLRRHSLLSGIGFGAMLFVTADEIAVPATGLSGPAQEAPLSSHLYALASHIVYGLTAGAVRQTVRGAL